MPTISRFRGISIYMYTEPGSPHHAAHFHAYYGEYSATFSIDPPNLLDGEFPRRQLRFVLAWAELHQETLEEVWQLVQDGQKPIKIKGL